MKLPLRELLDQDPASLASTGAAVEPFLELHERYRGELVVLTTQMARLRREMRARGCGAELGDRESELLYLTVREMQPETVVEISPRHGYSTNYLLAALAANGRGTLHSYEVEAAFDGMPIEEVVRANQLPTNRQEQLVMHVGDARSQTIPAADVLFIDSAHEDHFAAWLYAEHGSRARVVIHHDIVMREVDQLAPKAWYLGPRESSFVLEALRRDGRRFFSSAAAAMAIDRSSFRHLTPRYGGIEFAVLYEGGPSSSDAAALCDVTRLIHRRRVAAVEGRHDEIVSEIPGNMGFAERCAYGRLLAESGFSAGNFFRINEYDERVWPRLDHDLSLAELVYYVDYLTSAHLVADLVKWIVTGRPACINAAFGRLLRAYNRRRLLGRVR